jgi:hypothetical protein
VGWVDEAAEATEDDRITKCLQTKVSAPLTLLDHRVVDRHDILGPDELCGILQNASAMRDLRDKSGSVTDLLQRGEAISDLDERLEHGEFLLFVCQPEWRRERSLERAWARKGEME